MNQIDFNYISKTAARPYGNLIGKRLSYARDESEVKNILYAPYAYDEFDSNEIKEVLQMMIPENMIIYFQSKVVQELKD